MIFKRSVLFPLFLMLSSFLFGKSESDTVPVINLKSNLYYYNQASQAFMPLVDQDSFNEKTIHFKLNRNAHRSLLLRVISNQKNLSIFVNSKLVTNLSQNESALWKTDNLFDQHGDILEYTMYAPKISVKKLKLQLLSVQKGQSNFLKDERVIVVKQRDLNRAFNNFLITGIIIVMSLLALLYNYYPRVTKDFLRISRAIAIREIDENLLKSRPFTRINVLFYAYFSMLAGYALICVFYLAPFEVIEPFTTVWSALWLWLEAALVILLWILVKFLIVSNFTSLFNIRSFLPSHYFNYIRMGLVLFMLLTASIIISYQMFEVASPGFYSLLFTILLTAICLRTLFIMLKLMNSASYKFLHLFSYLCGTELIPLGIILFLGFNQPF